MVTFTLTQEVLFEFRHKIEEKDYIPCCERVSLKPVYPLLFTVSTFETAVGAQMKVAMWSGNVGTFPCEDLAFSSFVASRKEIVVHSVKYCQYD